MGLSSGLTPAAANPPPPSARTSGYLVRDEPGPPVAHGPLPGPTQAQTRPAGRRVAALAQGAEVRIDAYSCTRH